MELNIPDDQLSRFSRFVAEATGLHFPPSRWPDLKRAIAATASSLGFEDAAGCAGWLMSTPRSNQLDVLASHLTVGETYFFRDNRSFEVLTEQILPPLIRERQGSERRLRIWSAACCTGEEAYSIAIALRRALPDYKRWDITLLATDINPVFLRKAESGLYSQWSFRDTPDQLKEQYFRVTADGQFQIRPEIRQMVRFSQLNLAEDLYPSPATNTHAMDIIYCRNVLMYFTASQATNVLRRLYRAQADGGWLIVGPSELSHVASTAYAPANVLGAALFRKNSTEERGTLTPFPDIPGEGKHARCDCPGSDAGAANIPPLAIAPPRQSIERPDPSAFSLLARSLANQGKLLEALECCDRSIAADKLNPASHYLRALILHEQGARDDAVQSLRNALYLDPKFVLAYFTLGNIARDRGQIRDARKHLAVAQQLLSGYQPEDILPESDGMTVERFAEIIRSLMNAEAAV